MRPFLAVFILGVSLVTAFSTLFGQAKAAAMEQVRSAAEARLFEFLNRIPVGQEAAYGFRSRSEFVEATPGEPYQMFTLASRGIPSGQDYALETLNEWRVPVRVRGESRALLTVTRIDEQWRVVDFGAALLARDLADCEQRNALSPRALHRGILRLFDSSCDLLLMYDPNVSMDNAKVLPLESARQALLKRGLVVMDQQSVREYLPLLVQLSTLSDTHR